MRQWNGLLKKEWALMRGAFYVSVGAAGVFTILIPLGNQLFKWGIDHLEIFLGISFLWMMLSAGIPTVIFLISFIREMNRPDMWLHSSASIYKLFGSKMVFAGFVGLVNMIIVLCVNAMGITISGILFGPTFKAIVLFYLLLYLASLLIMCAGLFVGVLYQLIKAYAKGLTVALLLVLWFISIRLVDKVTATEIYGKISGFGPIKGPSEGVYYFGEDNFFMELDGIVLYTGNIFMGLLLGALFFITAAILFEKKVRL